MRHMLQYGHKYHSHNIEKNVKDSGTNNII